MELLLVADGHYYMDKSGDVYVESVFDYNFYQRYLSVFDKVYAVARIQHVDTVPAGKKKSSGKGVTFLELPNYVGPWEYVRSFSRIRKLAREYAGRFPVAIFRLPGATANIMCKEFYKTGKPFGVEIVVDPWENFAPGSIDSMLRPVIRYSWTKVVRDMCQKANGAAYVTEKYLQEKYPCPALIGTPGFFTGSYSSVELPDDSFSCPRQYEKKDTWIISHVANSFSDHGKGHLQLMNALKIVREKGYDVRVRFIGDGPMRGEFEQYGESLGIGDAVEFLGRLPSGAEVKKEVSGSDMFVFPTRAEGLPRGLLEAMSEGLPCLSCPTCGIPEVLEKQYLYAYEDAQGFAEGIIRFITHPELMTEQSKVNLEVARRYRSSVLTQRRYDFYETLQQVAQGRCTE